MARCFQKCRFGVRHAGAGIEFVGGIRRSGRVWPFIFRRLLLGRASDLGPGGVDPGFARLCFIRLLKHALFRCRMSELCVYTLRRQVRRRYHVLSS